MHRREDPRRLAGLVAVQRVRRIAAEAALGCARDDERSAIANRDTAAERLGEAETGWIEHVTAAAFAPERLQALAGVVITSEAAVERAENDLDGCRETLEHCGEAWRMAEALVRSIERDHATAMRTTDRRLEEKRLAERDDRTIRKWGLA